MARTAKEPVGLQLTRRAALAALAGAVIARPAIQADQVPSGAVTMMPFSGMFAIGDRITIQGWAMVWIVTEVTSSAVRMRPIKQWMKKS